MYHIHAMIDNGNKTQQGMLNLTWACIINCMQMNFLFRILKHFVFWLYILYNWLKHNILTSINVLAGYWLAGGCSWFLSGTRLCWNNARRVVWVLLSPINLERFHMTFNSVIVTWQNTLLLPMIVYSTLNSLVFCTILYNIYMIFLLKTTTLYKQLFSLKKLWL
jgi:hypothetical protein